MKNGKPIIVGVSGLGVGERHAKAIKLIEGVSLKKIFDPDIEKSSRISKELRVAYCNNFDELVNDEAIDVVIVASPDNFHCEQIIKAIKKGKHVFAEKPLCNTFLELKKISNVWSKYNDQIKLYSNLILREAPLYKWLKESIKNGTFGEIFSIEGDYLYGRKEKITNGWRGKAQNYTGMNGGGIHLVDLMCWITNQYPVSLYTTGNNIATKDSDIEIFDFMSTTFRFESGMIGRITANLGCIHRHHHILKIFGTKATFIYDDQGPRIHLSNDPKEKAKKIKYSSLPKGKSEILPIFINAIRQNIDSRKVTTEIFNVISILSCCNNSINSKREEKIQYL